LGPLGLSPFKKIKIYNRVVVVFKTVVDFRSTV
jgi:hypothetical protein